MQPKSAAKLLPNEVSPRAKSTVATALDAAYLISIRIGCPLLSYCFSSRYLVLNDVLNFTCRVVHPGLKS